MTFDAQKVLDIRGMSKTFPGQRALSDVSFDVLAGEIHGLVGENGSGKSTLIKCLAGYHNPDSGSEILLDNKPLPHRYAPSEARGYGLSFMHQDLGLIPSLTVLENLALASGFTKTRLGRIRWRSDEERARRLLDQTGHDISPRAVVRDLSRADQALVALARVLADTEARVAVFDEPTAALTPAELPRMMAGIRAIAERGAAVIYVSHRLSEVLALSQRVTVLRDGHRLSTVPTSELDEPRLVREIVGPEMADAMAVVKRDHKRATFDDAPVVLNVENVSGPGVADVSFDVRQGEILGIAGLLGSGRTELARLLFGATPIDDGGVQISGEPLRLRRPADARRAGIALVPEERLLEGIFPDLSVRENATILRTRQYWTPLGFRTRKEAEDVKQVIDDFNVRPADSERPVRLLSGGNQQKVVLGKWMYEAPKLLILDEPMHGIDVGAKADVARIVRRAADGGAAVVLIDSDFGNLLELADRVVVLSHGRQTATLAADSLTREQILQAAYRDPDNKGERRSA